MQNTFTKLNILFALLCFMLVGVLRAQQAPIQYFRPWDQTGINIFEPSKWDEQPAYDGLKIRLGASFTQDFQMMTHSNAAVYFAESPANPVNKNLLYGAGTGDDGDTTTAQLNGFTTAMANLNLDVQLEDGIRLCVESYMSTRHHPEFWVKGGYIQVDKLPMFGNPEWFSKYVRLKVGEFVPNYGDMHFRRSDAGNCIYNPFVENLVLDAWTTEIGGEVYLFPIQGLTLVAGATNGQIHGEVKPFSPTPPPGFADPFQRKPSFLFKASYDKTINDLRFRLSASSYSNAGSELNSMYLGDRAGSHYSMVMEQERSLLIIDGVPSGIGPSTPTNNKDSGRFLPVVNNQVNSLMFNGFLKWKDLEFFGTYETMKGRMNFEQEGTTRQFDQIAAEVIYRLLPKDQLYVGLKYNTMTGTQLFQAYEVTVNRLAFAAGWFATKNILLKAEYVSQTYDDFTPFDYQFEGEFSGVTVQAVVGF
jgi:hypothetical protein